MWIKREKHEIETNDKEKICRTCLTKMDIGISIFSKKETTEEALKLHEMLGNCTFIHVIKCRVILCLTFL